MPNTIVTVASVALMTSIISPDPSDIYYLMERGKQGPFYYDSSSTLTANTGTIISSNTGGNFLRIYQSNTVHASWFGAVGDGMTDCYDAIQNAIDCVNGDGMVMLGEGIFLLDKSLAGGIKLPMNANGIAIAGSGIGTTTIKLSLNVPRAFDVTGLGSTTVAYTYQNISLYGFTVDANNINGASYGGIVTAVSTVISTFGGYTTVDVGNNYSFFQAGVILLPSSNSGNTKNTYLRYRVTAGSSSSLDINMPAGGNIMAGDSLLGASVGHVIVGSSQNNNGGNTNSNLNLNNITIRDITAINIITEPTSGVTNLSRTKRTGISLDVVPFAGYLPVLKVTNIIIKRVSVFGGSEGIGVHSSSAHVSANVFFDNILFEDCYHTTGVVPAYQFGSFNFIISNAGFGRSAMINRCVGECSGDVGMETDGLTNSIVTNSTVRNAWGSGFFPNNYNAPSNLSSGAPNTTLSTGITGSSTTLTVASAPANISISGFMTIGNTELVYYSLTLSSTINIVRGLNGTAGISHSAGETVVFLDMENQVNVYENCTYENTMLSGSGAGPGWQTKTVSGTIYPVPNLKIVNCVYVRTAPDSQLLPGIGEAVYSSGQNFITEINGLKVVINGIKHLTDDGINAGILLFENPNYDSAGGLTSVIPPRQIILNNIDTSASGFLDNGTTNANIYYGIIHQAGNFFINYTNSSFSFDFLNTTSTIQQVVGILLGFTGTPNYISGKIDTVKFSNKGNGAPVGIFTKANTNIRKLKLDNLDFTNWYTTPNIGNFFYVPYLLSTAYSNNVYIGTINPPLNLNLPVASCSGHSVTIAGNYTAGFDDETIFVNITSPVTITLPKVATNNSSIVPNKNVTLRVIDIGHNASTNNITIIPSSGETINNSSSYIMNINDEVVILTSTASNWSATK